MSQRALEPNVCFRYIQKVTQVDRHLPNGSSRTFTRRSSRAQWAAIRGSARSPSPHRISLLSISILSAASSSSVAPAAWLLGQLPAGICVSRRTWLLIDIHYGGSHLPQCRGQGHRDGDDDDQRAAARGRRGATATRRATAGHGPTLSWREPRSMPRMQPCSQVAIGIITSTQQGRAAAARKHHSHASIMY